MPEDEDPASLHRALVVVERARHLAHHVLRHLGVDLARQVDEARLVVQRAHLPREVVRVERDAVTADARSRREAHEPERLRSRGVDDFPDVDAELVADDRHLVHEPDVHGAERVLQQLDQFRRLGARDRDDGVDARGVERRRHFGARRGHATDNLGRVLRVPRRVARIDALRAERQERVLANATRLQLRAAAATPHESCPDTSCFPAR